MRYSGFLIYPLALALGLVCVIQLISCEDESLVRNKRQLGGCPDKPARGPDKGYRSEILIFNPKTKRDVSIKHRSGEWQDKSFKTLDENGFDPKRRTMLYLHAFLQEPKQTWLTNVRDQYVTNVLEEKTLDPYNLLFFDWSNYSQSNYKNAVRFVPHLGKIVGNFLREIQERYNYNMTNMHLMSFSLSTHISGNAGRNLRKWTSKSLGQITALDPTGVCFHHENTDFAKRYGLRGTDADLVVAEHYDMNRLGSKRAIGGLDVYVNGGSVQGTSIRNLNPIRFKRGAENETIHIDDDVLESGLDNADDDEGMMVSQAGVGGLGSHTRAILHETGPEDDDCHDVAYKCKSYSAYLAGECSDCGPDGTSCYYTNTLGNVRNGFINPSKYPPGTEMYLKTAGLTPFCQQLYQVLVKLNDGSGGKLLKDRQVTIDLGGSRLRRGTEVNPLNKKSSKEYTNLMTSKTRLSSKELKSATMRVGSNQSKDDVQSLIKNFDHVQVNYMSHAKADVRKKNSVKLCLKDSQNNDSGSKTEFDLVECKN